MGMDSPTERMPIACVHCAKAKAKCDKKVPCTRCVTKQILCQSRATRRSSHAIPKRPTQHNRQTSDSVLHPTAHFHGSQLPTPPDGHTFSPSKLPPPLGPRHYSFGDHDGGQLHGNASLFSQELDPHFLHGPMTSTPPEGSIPITPILHNMPGLDDLVTLGNGLDHDGANPFLPLGDCSGQIEFDMSNVLDFMTPPTMMPGISESFIPATKSLNPLKTSLVPEMGFCPAPPNMRPSSPLYSNSSDAGLPQWSRHLCLQEPDAVMAGLDSWPFFRCNPTPKSSSPKTAKIYLEGLAQTLRSQETWSSWKPFVDTSILCPESKLTAEPIVGWPREKLIAITQGFLHKALDIHRAVPASREHSPGSPDSQNSGFLMLPPPNIIQHFLRCCRVRLEPYYACNPAGLLDASYLMHASNSKASSLLVLLMIAQGAAATPSLEARYLTSGLTEACRISLFDIIEKDVYLSRDPLMLRSALLFTTLAAWSGDKWHMDIAMGQRGMYISMLRHSGLIESVDSTASMEEWKKNPQNAWRDWQEQETKNRLAYSWVIVDQEMSLFGDMPSLFSIVNLNAPMPDNDTIWQARSELEWLQAMETVHNQGYKAPDSVCALFSRFVDGELGSTANTLSAIQLRLLLHPLQALVCQLRQFLECLPDSSNHGKIARAVSKAATKARLEEVSAMLQQWYDMSKQCSENIEGMCWTTCANLIVYHLISLNVVTSFPAIEQFARRECSVPQSRQVAWLQNRCIDHAEEAIFHCGQVLRLVQTMPEQVRPPWWAGAVYRVALIAWATSTAYPSSHGSVDDGIPTESNTPFSIDALTPEHPAINRYVKYQEGVPNFTKRDGSTVSLDVPLDIISHCCDVLGDDPSMRLTDGIKSKLEGMIDRWRSS